ncbi:hypothetical protein CC1G_14621 [Coprinopsis cinerea okayama7|uniref:Uncharacterized protein n=1 Tax=Coprinopsis cinerea (strain Okayama-7 / 130 / ATCC MYA-4618 / FGSC 9003) TaxID=240176 RepID=D6RMR3_COPC7|nr:hypothetical protein CC1G_14621 [Coprinopsis cinerea okayama7\|eukprot:XP_002911190.1 hypothetical protein CC1G_14621 [Coprinopsis cinerea okayama7\
MHLLILNGVEIPTVIQTRSSYFSSTNLELRTSVPVGHWSPTELTSSSQRPVDLRARASIALLVMAETDFAQDGEILLLRRLSTA